MKQNNIFRDGSALLATVAVTLMGLLICLGAMMHLYSSLAQAVNDLHVCERASGVECHIERDRFEYNVYSKGE